MYCSRIVSVFKHILFWLVRIFNSSDDALLVRAKRQNFNKNMDELTGFVFDQLWLKWLRLSRCMIEIYFTGNLAQQQQHVSLLKKQKKLF